MAAWRTLKLTTNVILLSAVFMCGLTGCTHRLHQALASRPSQAAHDSVEAIATELAAAVSHRDADAAARRVREDDRVVYVSDGLVIRGRDYRSTLRRFYSGMSRIEFRWDSTEVRVLDDRTAVFTGWARIALTDNTGREKVERAVTTMTCAQRDGWWEMVAGHKTTLR